mmetsp:Transcript_36065/g.94564  ORF Transcript_36065/g.94564 Transcript_36065/m.94564 type:complete len:260 (-) Transcript_36065:713-1492(-)
MSALARGSASLTLAVKDAGRCSPPGSGAPLDGGPSLGLSDTTCSSGEKTPSSMASRAARSKGIHESSRSPSADGMDTTDSRSEGFTNASRRSLDPLRSPLEVACSIASRSHASTISRFMRRLTYHVTQTIMTTCAIIIPAFELPLTTSSRLRRVVPRYELSSCVGSSARNVAMLNRWNEIPVAAKRAFWIPNGTGVSRVIITILRPCSPSISRASCAKLLKRLSIFSVHDLSRKRHSSIAKSEPASAATEVSTVPRSTP